MKVKSLLIVALVLAFATVNAQRSQSSPQTQSLPFAKGDNIINLGIGLGTTLYSGVGYSGTLPPLSVSFEHILKDGIADGKGAWGVGGYLGYSAAKWEFTDPYIGTWGWKYTFMVIGARGTFHYNFVEKLDTYGGLFLGYDIVSSKEIGTLPVDANAGSTSEFKPSIFVGGRYYFSDKFAGMAEIGYGIADLTLGVALKL